MGSSPISGTNKMTSKNAVIFYLKIIISSGNKPRIIKKAPKRYFFETSSIQQITHLESIAITTPIR